MGKDKLDSVDGNVKEKFLRDLKYVILKKSVISYFCLVFSGLSAIGR